MTSVNSNLKADDVELVDPLEKRSFSICEIP